MENQDLIKSFIKASEETGFYEYMQEYDDILFYQDIDQAKIDEKDREALQLEPDEILFLALKNINITSSGIWDYNQKGLHWKEMYEATQNYDNYNIEITLKNDIHTNITIDDELPEDALNFANLQCITHIIETLINTYNEYENSYKTYGIVELLSIYSLLDKRDEYKEKKKEGWQKFENMVFPILDDIDQNLEYKKGYNDEGYIFVCSRLAKIYREFEDYENAMKYCNKGIAICDKNNKEDEVVNLFLTRADIFEDYYSDYKSERRDAIEALNRTDDYTKQTKIKEALKKIDQLYLDEFINQPYSQRKLIMPVRKYVDLSQENISVLDIKTISSLNFPMGHPIANEIYVGHPLIPRKYIPLTDYKLELIEDKVREFCELAQALGATEISIECINNTKNDDNRSSNTQIDASGKISKFGGEINFNYNDSNRLVNELEKRINLHQSFVPEKKPHIPEGLVWYDNEPSWQRLVRQRMNGNIKNHTEKISTRNSTLVESQELMSVKGEVHALFNKMGVNYENEDKAKYYQEDNAELIINVTFASKNETIKNQKSNNLQSDAESNYLNMVKIAIQDGTISPDERIMLNAIRESSGITQERAEELEQSLSSKLSDDEQYYLNMYQQLLNENGITESTRAMLNELRKIKNISEERALEIENMAN